MNFLVSDIQDYSQYRNNKFKLILNKFNLYDVTQEISELFNH